MIKQLAGSVTILFALCALLQAGPEQISGKEMKQAVEPLAEVQWYADNEWNVSIWGAYVFTGNGAEDALPLEEIPWSGDRYLGTDDAWGGGIDLKYFFRHYFGVGVEGFGLAVHRDAPASQINLGQNGSPFELRDEDKFVGGLLGTFTLRYPVGRFAPYIFAGLGGIFGGGDVQHLEFDGMQGQGQNYYEVYRGGESTALLGQFGAGLEVRFTRHIGVMADFSWNVIDGQQNNFGMARSGLSFAF
jgi:hypothetical protein